MRQSIFKLNTASLVLLAFIMIMTTGFTVGHADQVKNSADKKLLLPDLQVHSVKVDKIGTTAAKDHRVRITVKVKNVARFKNCCGPFKVKLEWTDGNLSDLQYLGEAGVARLCSNPISARLVLETRTFEDTVPVGTTRKYKATVDSMNQVTEIPENNNEGFAEYRAPRLATTLLSDRVRMRFVCPGIDLALTRIEIRRTDRGMFIKAYAKNRCTGSCSGGVRFVLDESEVAGEPSAVTQDVAVSISSGGEYSTSGWIGVRSKDDRTCTYTVSVEALTPCSESHLSNNYCEVSIAPSQTYVDQTSCH